MRTSLIFTTAAALALTLGCDPEPKADSNADGFASHLPDNRILIGIPAGGDRAVGELAESYATTVQVSGDLNGIIGSVLDTINHITDFEPTYADDENRYLWGPWDDGGLDPNHTALWVEYDESEQRYGWAIIQRDKESNNDDDWVAVIGGDAFEGNTDDTGNGSFIIDYDAISLMNPAENKTGQFVSTYEITEDAVIASVAFVQFTEDGSEPLDAGYSYEQDPTGAGQMDLAYIADVQEDASQLETVVLRTRWMADGAGRGDTVVFGGDLGVLIYQASECWDDGFNVTFEENNADLFRDGDEASCAFATADWNDDAPEG